MSEKKTNKEKKVSKEITTGTQTPMATAHFSWGELIAPELYKEFKNRWHELLDANVIEIAEWLRVETGKPIIINNWQSGGQFKYSGVRPMDCPIGAKGSAHKVNISNGNVIRKGCALDLKVSGFSEQDLYELIKKNYKDLFNKGLRQVESPTITVNPKTGEGWVHISTRRTGKNCVQVITNTAVIETWSI